MRKTAASSSATHGNAGRLPTMVAINAITIATPQGQRCNRQSSHGANPPQYCDSSTTMRTTVLVVNTKTGNCRVSDVTLSQIAQCQEAANQCQRKGARHQHQTAFDEFTDRIAKPPQQRGEQKEPHAARDDRGQNKGQ